MFYLKQYLKMFLQNVLLPLVYAWHVRKPVQRGLVLFADAHHEEIPFSMRRMYEELTQADADGKRTIQVFVRDFNRMPYLALVRYLFRFMKAYAQAEYVFLCDYFLPVSSCRKRPETTVVQLWHSCGLMKKIAYDTGEDIPKNYRGDLFGNYTWLTLSGEACVEVHAKALRIPAKRIVAAGVSRTDYYFDPAWNRRCREVFYRQYPEAQGKRIILWAPTFRENAAHPVLQGLEEVREAARRLGESWYLLIKAHPHIDAHGLVSNCVIPTEELLCVADVLVTDYSSVLYDYLIYEKPAVLFAPDLEAYERERGFYIDYRSLPFPVTGDAEGLAEALARSREDFGRYSEKLREWKETYCGACDGHATRRILELAMGRQA